MAKLDALLEKYKEDLRSVAVLSSGALATFVSTETPVDEGTAQASWTPSVNELKTENIYPAEGDERRHDPVAVANTMEIGDSFFYANGTDHILPLEYGHSQQGQAMVRRGVAKWQRFVDESAQKVKNGN